MALSHGDQTTTTLQNEDLSIAVACRTFVLSPLSSVADVPSYLVRKTFPVMDPTYTEVLSPSVERTSLLGRWGTTVLSFFFGHAVVAQGCQSPPDMWL